MPLGRLGERGVERAVSEAEAARAQSRAAAVEAEVRVVLKAKDESVSETIHRESADAAAVFLGLQVPEVGDEEAYAERIERLAGDLPVVFFVKNSSLFVGVVVNGVTCWTGADGACQITVNGIPKNVKTVTFRVTLLTDDLSLYVYDAQNHDPDGDSDGTTITIAR